MFCLFFFFFFYVQLSIKCTNLKLLFPYIHDIKETIFEIKFNLNQPRFKCICFQAFCTCVLCCLILHKSPESISDPAVPS